MAQQSTSLMGEPELIVIVKQDSAIRATPTGITSDSSDSTSLQSILDMHDAKFELLFGLSEHRLRNQQSHLLESPEFSEAPASDLPDLATFYRVHAPTERLEEIAETFLAHDSVEAAYVKPAASVPIFTDHQALPMVSSAEDLPPVTPNFTSRQGYLNPAPGGIDALYAATLAGGRGAHVRITDCEWGWTFTHEDLVHNQGGVISGTSSTIPGFVEHGTAVIGVMSGDLNQMGITGIAPDAIIFASSFNSQSTSAAIKAAADKLGPGDIIVLEIHRPGPKTPDPRQGQRGFICIEWWPDDFAAIRYAVAKGIVVVEAAGNGFQNLDDPIYNIRPPGFPSTWTNPFNPANPQSGAIVIGAGAPPPGTHGRNYGPDRSRLDFSNYGRRVDAQGWGREVTTTGYGDLQSGASKTVWYTDIFNGTSSATPIVAGAMACIQGVRKANGRRPLNSWQSITLLRNTGSPQQPSPLAPLSQRIGNRPNLREAIPRALSSFP